jgi:hypothetical protein
VSRPGRRAALLGAAAVVLAVAAVVLFVLGVQVRETTGGLLVTPIRQLHLVGGALLGGTVAGVAAVLVALVAVPAARRARQPGTGGPADPADAEPAPPTEGVPEEAPAGDAETAAISPGPDHRT